MRAGIDLLKAKTGSHRSEPATHAHQVNTCRLCACLTITFQPVCSAAAMITRAIAVNGIDAPTRRATNSAHYAFRRAERNQRPRASPADDPSARADQRGD